MKDRQPNGYYNITDYGAIADGTTMCTDAIQGAIDAAGAAGGGTVFVPAGTFRTGPLRLRDRVTLHLDAGSRLLASENIDDFPIWASDWEGPDAVKACHPFIGGEGLRDIAITGRGTIDGSGHVWWARHLKNWPKELPRPLLVRFVNCSNVLVEGVTLTNSPMWTLSPLACDNVSITHITIKNPPDSPNTDGINPDSCSNVRISDCHVDVGDDCITIKSGKETDGRRQLKACENITVTNCTLVRGHGGVVIGSEISGSVRNVAITNCVFVGTDRGIRLKARRGRGGVVEDIRASNLVMDRVLTPISVNLFYGCGAWDDPRVNNNTPMPVDETTPQFRRIRFAGITATGAKYAAAYIVGLPEMHVQDVSLKDVLIRIDRNNAETGEPDMSPLIPMTCRAGIVARNVSGFTLSDVEVIDSLGPCVRVSDCERVTLTGVIARPGDDSVEAPLFLRDIRGGRVDRCGFPVDTAVAVVVSGEGTDSLSVGANDYGRAEVSVAVADDVIASRVRFDHGPNGSAGHVPAALLRAPIKPVMMTVEQASERRGETLPDALDKSKSNGAIAHQ
jgi:polygalacturonase